MATELGPFQSEEDGGEEHNQKASQRAAVSVRVESAEAPAKGVETGFRSDELTRLS
jgi:hypothetical protein